MSQTKKVAQLVTKSLSINDERVLHFIATAPTLDRDFEVLSTADIRIPTKNGIKYASELTDSDETIAPLLIEHDWTIKAQAGVVFRMKMNELGQLEAFAKLSTNANGEEIYQMAKEDMLGNSFSIGYTLGNATDEEGQIKNIELLEISVVATASNPDAKLISYKSADKGEKMAEATKSEKIDALKAELKSLEEAVVVETPAEPVEEVPAEEVKEEVVETPVAPVVEISEEEVEEVAEAPVVEAPVEIKSIKKETKMTDVTKSIVPEVTAVEQPETVVKSMDKYDLVAKQFVAFVNKDQKTLSELNEIAIKSYVGQNGTKATYLNAATTADGGSLVPSAELMAEVYTVLADYSTVANDLKVVTLTEGNSLDIATLVTDVIIREVATEGGKKSSTKPVTGEAAVSLREFAGIAIVTKKLVRQAAINIFDMLRDSFARAIATQRSKMALTDSATGIGVIAGTASSSSAAAVPTYAEIAALVYDIPAGATQGAKYYIARTVLASLAAAVDSTGRNLDLVRLDGTGVSGTLANGFPFVVEETLVAGSGLPLVIFGNMGRYGILLRQGTVEAETFDTGIVNDGTNGAGGTDHNLLQDNKLAYRVAFYENVGFPVPSAFAVLKQVAA